MTVVVRSHRSIVIVRVHGNDSSDPGGRGRGSSDNPKFIVQKEHRIYEIDIIQRERWKQEREVVAGGDAEERSSPVVPGGEEITTGEKTTLS